MVDTQTLASVTATDAERTLLAELRLGNEDAFAELVDAHGPAMLRVARLYVRDAAVAEEVVQEAWLNVLRSLDGFEERSSLRTWIFVILGNVARRRAEREARSVPVGELESAVESDRFFGPEHPRWAGAWTTLVDSWQDVPERRLLAGETRAKFREAIAALPPRYAVILTLRDVEGWSSDEVCGLLGLSAANQRVLLHRARARIRAALERYLEQDEP